MAFATTDDIAARLGRELSDSELDRAEWIIPLVQALILEVAGTAEPNPAPAYYRALCVEKTINVIENPSGLATESESLGDWSHSQTFQRAGDAGVFLTDREEQMIRRIANNAASGSSRPHSIVHDTYVAEG